MTILRIQYASNLFLNNLKNPIMTVKPVAPILALLGNIGNTDCPYTKVFFQWAETEFKRIYWIPGNLEYSSGSSQMTWREKSDLHYSTIQSWKLKRTVFSQKFQGKLGSVNILATPGWHNRMSEIPKMQISDWNSDGEIKTMSSENIIVQQIDELDWIIRKTEKSVEPTILLTYSPISHTILRDKRILCHLYGTEYEDKHKSLSGGINPWVGINMGSSTMFRKDAFVEINPKYL